MPDGSYEYKLDVTGNLPANKIIGEVHTVTKENEKDYNFIIPRYAPYHANSLRVFLKEGISRTSLKEGTDWNPSLHFTGASLSIGRPVYGAISFNRPDFEGEVEIEYQTLGGQYTLDKAGIAEILANIIYNPRGITWEKIVNLPTTFAPTDHLWNFEDMVGMREIKEALLKIEEAILNKDFSKWENHITNYNNPHKVSKAQVGLSNVENYPVATISEAITGSRGDAYLTPQALKAVLDRLGLTVSADVIEKMLRHLTDYNNPHRTEKGQIGLGNVENLPVVTPSDILARRSVRKYVTLDEMMRYLALYGCTPGSDIKEMNHPPKGALLSVYCNNLNRLGVYADGNGGSYEEIIEVDSERCGYVEQKPIQYPEQGTLLSKYCVGLDQFGLYADGYGGTFQNLIQMNAEECGFEEYPEKGTILSSRCDKSTLVKTVADGKGGSYELREENSKDCESCEAAGTLVEDHYTVNGKKQSFRCDSSYTKFSTFHDGKCGTYEKEVEFKSKDCGYKDCAAKGTVITASTCQGYDEVKIVADGNCGQTVEIIKVNSTKCGAPDCSNTTTPISNKCSGSNYIEIYNTGKIVNGKCETKEVNKGEVVGKCGVVECTANKVISTKCNGTTLEETYQTGKRVNGKCETKTRTTPNSVNCGFNPKIVPAWTGCSSSRQSGNNYYYTIKPNDAYKNIWKGTGFPPNTTFHLYNAVRKQPQAASQISNRTPPHDELDYATKNYWVITSNASGAFTWNRDNMTTDPYRGSTPNPNSDFFGTLAGTYGSYMGVYEFYNGTYPNLKDPASYSGYVEATFEKRADPTISISFSSTYNNREVIMGDHLPYVITYTVSNGPITGNFGYRIKGIAAGPDGLVADNREGFIGGDNYPAVAYQNGTHTLRDNPSEPNAWAKDLTIKGKHSIEIYFKEKSTGKVVYSNPIYITWVPIITVSNFACSPSTCTAGNTVNYSATVNVRRPTVVKYAFEHTSNGASVPINGTVIFADSIANPELRESSISNGYRDLGNWYLPSSLGDLNINSARGSHKVRLYVEAPIGNTWIRSYSNYCYITYTSPGGSSGGTSGGTSGGSTGGGAWG